MPSVAVQTEIYQLKQLIARRGELVNFIERTTLTGANPAPNPPTVESLVVDGATLAGDGTINVRAYILTGRLIPGDIFNIAGDPTDYTVSAQVIAPSLEDTLTGVTFTPNLAFDAADGAAVTLTPVAIIPNVRALVTHFPMTLINGTSILQTDRRVRVLAGDLGSWEPRPGSQMELPSESTTYEILQSKTVRDQGNIYAYFLQLRR